VLQSSRYFDLQVVIADELRRPTLANAAFCSSSHQFLKSLLHAEFSRQLLSVSPIVDHPSLRHHDQSSLTTGIALRHIFRVQIAGKPLAKFFCIREGFHPIPFLRDRIYLEELAASNREEAERAGRLTHFFRSSVFTAPIICLPTIRW
jgi:hypothetical protein